MLHGTFGEVVMHPCAAGKGLHDDADVGDAVGFIEAGTFLRLSDVLAIGAVVGQLHHLSLMKEPTTVRRT